MRRFYRAIGKREFGPSHRMEGLIGTEPYECRKVVIVSL